jgi:hypothetical protein
VSSTATLVSATPSQGSCQGSATVTCSLGQLAAGASATVQLVATPTASGLLENRATVSAVTRDADGSDNEVITALTVA